MGKYLYAIIEQDEKKELWKTLELERTLHAVPYKRLSAVCREAPIKLLEGSPEELLDHNQTLLKLMDSFALIPMSFGIIASSNQEIEDLLSHGYSIFEEAINKLRGHVEYNLELHWDEQQYLKNLAQENSQIRELQESLRERRGAITVVDKLELGRLAVEALEKKKAELIKRVREGLTLQSAAYASLPRSDKPSVLSHMAFLVLKKEMKKFEETIYVLDKSFDGRLKFQYVGPLPPYAFSGIEFKIVGVDEIKQANSDLGLSKDVTWEKLKTAYWNLSKELHPDAVLADKTDQEKFTKLNQTYKLLTAFYRNYGYNTPLESLPKKVIFVMKTNVGETQDEREW